MLTLLLVAGAALTLAFVILKVRKSEIKTSDTVFWFLFVACLLADVFDVQSPANLVFLVIVAILLIKEFTASVEIAKLRSKVTYLVQEIALMENEEEDQGCPGCSRHERVSEES